MDEQNVNDAGQSQSSPASTFCRVAIIGAQRQRVARVSSLLHADDTLGFVSTSSLSSFEFQQLKASDTIAPPPGIPPFVNIEYLPCVATFDSYEDENSAIVRYLVKLEYHGPNGMLVKGKSLAPFFDDIVSSVGDDDGGDENKANDFPGIAAVAIGCGIETEEDVEKIRGFLETLSSSCEAQISTKQSATATDGNDDTQSKVLIKCIQPNAKYSSMKEENEAFRGLSDDEKKEAVQNGTIGPGKMAHFAHQVATDGVRQRWGKELAEYEQSLNAHLQQTSSSNDDERGELIEESTIPDEIQQTAAPHTPNPEKIRYACKRCRTILFGEDDLEDPPHAQSMHNFSKRGHSSGVSGPCQNHFVAQPLPWMNGCSDMEGKLHCPKCNTKVGHYSWTGAQCSCGTWVTPAIMVPVSKVDEMKPISQKATGAMFIDCDGLMRAKGMESLSIPADGDSVIRTGPSTTTEERQKLN